MSTQSNGSASDVTAVSSQALNGNSAGFTMPATDTNQFGFTTGIGSAQQLPATLGGVNAPDFTTAAMSNNSTGFLGGQNAAKSPFGALGKTGTQLKAPTDTGQQQMAMRGGGVRLPSEQFSSGVSGTP